MLTPDIDRYLELRRAMGVKLVDTERCLRSFARFAEPSNDMYLKSQTATAWAMLASTVRRRDKRMVIVIGFARFMHAEDSRHELPPRTTVCRSYPRPAPYIFSPEEIQRLVQAAARLGKPGSLRPYTFSTLFNLLAVTGLRIREALTLRIEDFTPDGLVVRNTKFHKSRLVALHETTAAALTRYLERRQHVPTRHDYLFTSRRRTPLCYATVHRMFRQLCIEADIQGAPPAPRPRLHDLRHTVAVRSLQACPNARKQVSSHMLALSTLLGHSSLQGTYWYLHCSPPLMQDIAEAGHTWVMRDKP